MSQVEGASWSCNACGAMNIPSHRMCEYCKTWRELDWNCTSCGFKNFAKRETCKNCTARKEDQQVVAYQGGYQEGYQGEVPPQEVAADFTAPYEGQGLNTPFADVPYSSLPKNYNEYSHSLPDAAEEMPWLCGLCNTENASKRILCFECSGHRERVEVRNRLAESRQGIISKPLLTNPPPALGSSRSPSMRTPLIRNAPMKMAPRNDHIVRYPGGKVEDQSADWHCGECNNRNFAKRTKCNKCSKPRKECEVEKSPPPFRPSYSGPPRQPLLRQREPVQYPVFPIESENVPRPEDRTKDWLCGGCDNRNFAKRQKCNRCEKPREEVEVKDKKFENEEPQPFAHRKRVPEFLDHASKRIGLGRREDLTNDWYCGKCNINVFAKKSSCFRCLGHRQDVESVQGQPISYPRISGHNLQLHKQPPRNESSKPKREFVIEDRSKDWTCKFCMINNFVKRTVCFKCAKHKSECLGESTEENTSSKVEDNADESSSPTIAEVV